MIEINGRRYSTEFLARAIAAFEAAGEKDNGCDELPFRVLIATEKGELQVAFAADEYHSVFVDLVANKEQCRSLGVELDNNAIAGYLPIATIEVPDAAADADEEYQNYRQEEGYPISCPRIFLYDQMKDDCSHILLISGEGSKLIDN